MKKTKNSKYSVSVKMNHNLSTSLLTLDTILGWRKQLDKDRVNTICQQMMDWASQDYALDLNDFYSLLGTRREEFQDHRSRNQQLDKVWKFCKRIIYLRRQAMVFKHDPSSMKPTLRNELEEWRKIYDEDWNNKKKVADTKAESDNTIIIRKEIVEKTKEVDDHQRKAHQPE